MNNTVQKTKESMIPWKYYASKNSRGLLRKYKLYLAGGKQVAAESNQNLTGHIDGVDNIFSENFDCCFLRQIN